MCVWGGVADRKENALEKYMKKMLMEITVVEKIKDEGEREER